MITEELKKKIEARIELDANKYQMDDERIKLGPANSYKAGATPWAERCVELLEALEKIRDEYKEYNFDEIGFELAEKALAKFREGLKNV